MKWSNPDHRPGEQRDVAVMVGEGGGVFALDRGNGQFLWATPFPYETPNFLISNIDGRTGKTTINWDLVFKDKGEKNHIICFYNTRSYWPTAYSPETNSLYVPYNDNCLDMGVSRGRTPVPGPKADADKNAGVAKIDMSTGEIQPFYLGHAQTNGSVVVTAGELVFWGDLNRRFYGSRCRQRQGSMADTIRGRVGLGQHHHVCGERQTIRRGDDWGRSVDFEFAGFDSGSEASARL